MGDLIGEPAVQWAASILGDVQSCRLAWTNHDRRVLRLRTSRGWFYLKIAPGLTGERDRLAWLAGRLPVPAVAGFRPGPKLDWLLTAALAGQDLTAPDYRIRPTVLVELLAAALHTVHDLDGTDCPFGTRTADSVVVHGDACLPNFRAEENRVTGYLDVGEAGLGAPTIDLAAAVWSLEYNIGPGWGGPFLAAYGWENRDAESVERLRSSYSS